MKKLMIAVALVASTTSVHAASVNWSTIEGIGNATSDGFTAASMVYLVDSATLSQSDIYKAVIGGKSLTDAIGANSVASASLSDGKITAQKLMIDATGSKSYYMILLDSTIGANGALYFSEELTKTLSSVGTQYYKFDSDSSIDAVAANMSGFDSSKGGWVAVPEPTSGLLMLLGMAGLALKRKRA